MVMLSACNKDDDSGTTQTGVFIDNYVINIGYRTETQEGVTNSQGEYSYLPGETVIFYIGDLEFPPVTASGVVTPLDIARSTDTSNPTVVNISRLLQSLGRDGYPRNGLEITEAAKTIAPVFDITIDETTFENSTEILNLVANGGQVTSTTLISSVDAIAHLEETLNSNASPSVPLAFTQAELNNKTFYSVWYSDSNADDPACANGGWEISSESFNSTGVTYDGCDGIETLSYSVDNNGDLLYSGGVDVGRRLSWNNTIGAWDYCVVEGPLQNLDNCTIDDISKMFESLNDAQAYRDSL